MRHELGELWDVLENAIQVLGNANRYSESQLRASAPGLDIAADTASSCPSKVTMSRMLVGKSESHDILGLSRE